MKNAIITGINGQDGAYLAQHLLNDGYHVIGCDRRRVDSDKWRLKHLGIHNEVELRYMDLLDEGSIIRTIRNHKPDELYNLAAQSFVGVSFDQPQLTTQVDAIGVLRLLEALRNYKPDCKFYQASTSEMFGKVRESPQNEMTPLNPRSPYGVAKVYGHFITKNYRESFDMYACSGILFNHESPLRGNEFVTKKITQTIAKIKYGLTDKLILGNIDSKRDWGYAKDYTYGMLLMLQQAQPDDYVLATGVTHSVRKFTEDAFKYIDEQIVWEGQGVDEIGRSKATGKVLVEISEEFYRPAEVDLLLGDATKAKTNLDWESTTTLEELTQLMMEYDLEYISKFEN